MSTPDFTKQTDTPLFPEVLWSRPTMRRRAGRLLLVGGQRQEFSGVQTIYQLAAAAGIGECQAVLPDSLRRMVGGSGFARLAPASASGSLGKAALGEILAAAPDFDALVIGANLTTNAETAVMVESLLRQTEQPLVITEEAIEILRFQPALITDNPRALVVTTMYGLLALAGHLKLPVAIKPHAGVVGKVAILRQVMDAGRCCRRRRYVLAAAANQTVCRPDHRRLHSGPSRHSPAGQLLSDCSANNRRPAPIRLICNLSVSGI